MAMKYKLINTITKEKHLCDKVTIDEFDYYVSDDVIGGHDWYINIYINKLYHSSTLKPNDNSKKVMATTNSNIDVPKVVDEVERLAKNELGGGYKNYDLVIAAWKAGYNKSQETHQNSDIDMIGFADWVCRNQFDAEGYTQDKETKELLQLWKEQQPKIVYYA